MVIAVRRKTIRCSRVSTAGRAAATPASQTPDLLQRFFRKFIVDKAPLNVSKKMGALFIVVHMFKVYFRINNLRLCSNVVKAVHGQTFPSLDNFPKSQTVAFNYYFGRLKVFEAQYTEVDRQVVLHPAPTDSAVFMAGRRSSQLCL